MFPFWIEVSADVLWQLVLGGVTGLVCLVQTFLSAR
jgi:hypothetical protein